MLSKKALNKLNGLKAGEANYIELSQCLQIGSKFAPFFVSELFIRGNIPSQNKQKQIKK